MGQSHLSPQERPQEEPESWHQVVTERLASLHSEALYTIVNCKWIEQ